MRFHKLMNILTPYLASPRFLFSPQRKLCKFPGHVIPHTSPHRHQFLVLFTRILPFFILWTLCIFPYFSVGAAEEEGEQHGLVRWGLGYAWVDGEGTERIENIHPGWVWDYRIELSAELLRDGHELSYHFASATNTLPDLQLYWNHPLFTVEWDQGIPIQFPELNLAFQKNRIDGFSLRTTGNNVSIFHGREKEIPRRQIFDRLSPAQTLFMLIDPPTAGDIREYSEQVFLNGTRLLRERDYKLNYLSGKLDILVTVDFGMVLEVKYFFIPTVSDEDPPQGENIDGVYLGHEWNDNRFGAFYFRRGGATHQVGGISGRWGSGPLSITGEWALSQNDDGLHGAYDLKGDYVSEPFTLHYQRSEIAPDFREIGVNPYTQGRSEKLETICNLDEEAQFHLEMTRYLQREAFNQHIQGTFIGKLAPHQSLLLIYDNQSWKGAESATTGTSDISVGYTYQGDQLHLALGQSLKTAEQRFVDLTFQKKGIQAMGNYHLENGKDGKEHQAMADLAYRAMDGLDLMGYCEYVQPWDEDRGNWRLHLNSNWTPSPAWTLGAEYIFFNQVKYDTATEHYIGRVDHTTSQYQMNLNATNSYRETLAVRTGDLDLTGSLRFHIREGLQLNYQNNVKYFHEYMKKEQCFNQTAFYQSHLTGISYQWNQYQQTHLSLGYQQDVRTIQETQGESHTYTASVGWDYEFDQTHRISLNLGMEEKAGRTALHLQSKLVYPLRSMQVEYTGEYSFYPATQKVSQARIDFTLAHKPIARLTPSIRYQSNYLIKDQRPQQIETMTGTLRYHWQENQCVFLEFQSKRWIDHLDLSQDRRAVRFFVGTEISY